VESELAKLDFQFEQLDLCDPCLPKIQKDLTSALNRLNDTLVFVKNRLINLYAYTKQPKKKYGIRAKQWWCSTLQDYMDQLRLAYQNYKDSEYSPVLKTPYLEIKRLFRCRKRYKIQMKRDKNLKQLDDLFKNDRETFWKKIKDAQRTKQKIDMPLNTAAAEYKDLFNTPFD
jgi:flagellar biosynthesis chaperone FliJ